jgi:hypothetical protein
MMMADTKRIRAKVGDVFKVPVAEGKFVYGQVVDQAGPQYLVVVFRAATDSVEAAIASGIHLAGIVFDAKLRNGDWPIVENRAPVEVRAPWFVVGHEGLENLRLVSFDGKTTRPTNAVDAPKHPSRHISYPMVLQRAVQAEHGIGAWRSELDHFRELARELGGGSAA